MNRRARTAWLIAMLLSCIVIARAAKLILTLPLLALGIFLIAISTAPGSRIQGFARAALINTGILSILVSTIFSVLNIYSAYKGEEQPERPWTSDSTHYKNLIKPTSRSRSDDQGLGYRYKPNSFGLRARRVALVGTKEIPIYDVEYNINKHGNRLNPGTLSNGVESVLFIGDSLTFGEGLNDNETLPYYFGKLSNLNAINTGMHGYGAHQALRIISDADIYRDRTEGRAIKAIVYRPILNHINRTAGYSPWDDYGPCYKLEPNGKLIYQGRFPDCGKRSILDKTFERTTYYMKASNEPFTKALAGTISEHRISSTNYRESDYNLFLAVIKEMRNVATRKNADFIIVLENLSGPPGCKYQEYSGRLEKDLRRLGIKFLRSYDHLDRNECRSYKYNISQYDMHPTAKANQILASALYRKYFQARSAGQGS